jgi:hypothetical protein
MCRLHRYQIEFAYRLYSSVAARTARGSEGTGSLTPNTGQLRLGTSLMNWSVALPAELDPLYSATSENDGRQLISMNG